MLQLNMKDDYGRIYYTDAEAFRLVYNNPKVDLSNVILDDASKFNTAVEQLYSSIPKIKQYKALDKSVKEFDKANQNEWYMPKEYADFDIAKWVLDQCSDDTELQRAGNELSLYQA